jgi:hypothetical protein
MLPLEEGWRRPPRARGGIGIGDSRIFYAPLHTTSEPGRDRDQGFSDFPLTPLRARSGMGIGDSRIFHTLLWSSPEPGAGSGSGILGLTLPLSRFQSLLIPPRASQSQGGIGIGDSRTFASTHYPGRDGDQGFSDFPRSSPLLPRARAGTGSGILGFSTHSTQSKGRDRDQGFSDFPLIPLLHPRARGGMGIGDSRIFHAPLHSSPEPGRDRDQGFSDFPLTPPRARGRMGIRDSRIFHTLFCSSPARARGGIGIRDSRIDSAP